MSKREKFEKWSRRYIPDLNMSIDEGEYIDDEQRNNFEVWQAATKQSEARIKELEKQLSCRLCNFELSAYMYDVDDCPRLHFYEPLKADNVFNVEKLYRINFEISEWINVKNRLPNDSQYVEVWIKSTENPEYGKRRCSVLYVEDREPKFRNCLDSNFEYVSHWKPLPEPPKD